MEPGIWNMAPGSMASKHPLADGKTIMAEFISKRGNNKSHARTQPHTCRPSLTRTQFTPASVRSLSPSPSLSLSHSCCRAAKGTTTQVGRLFAAAASAGAAASVVNREESATDAHS